MSARREPTAARIRLLREIIALCRDLGLTLSEALTEYEASRARQEIAA